MIGKRSIQIWKLRGPRRDIQRKKLSRACEIASRGKRDRMFTVCPFAGSVGNRLFVGQWTCCWNMFCRIGRRMGTARYAHQAERKRTGLSNIAGIWFFFLYHLAKYVMRNRVFSFWSAFFLLLSQVCWDTQFLHYNDKEARITVTIFVRIELLPYLIVFVGICCILLCESAFTLQHFFIVYVVRHWTDSYLSSQLTERLCTYLKLPPFISVFLRWEK